jgi:actin-like ATPase involved in cell morphogenesis
MTKKQIRQASMEQLDKWIEDDVITYSQYTDEMMRRALKGTRKKLEKLSYDDLVDLDRLLSGL